MSETFAPLTIVSNPSRLQPLLDQHLAKGSDRKVIASKVIFLDVEIHVSPKLALKPVLVLGKNQIIWFVEIHVSPKLALQLGGLDIINSCLIAFQTMFLLNSHCNNY